MAESVEEFEQRQLQEKLSKMSPDELKAWQKEQCIFCKIISGEQPAKKVYEDNLCIAVLDIFPATPGHILLIPKDHYMVMPQIPIDTIKHLGMVSKAFAHACLRALGAEGSSIFIANGGAAGQRAQHFMLHIIPRREGDGVGLDPVQVSVSQEDNAKLAAIMPKIILAVKDMQEGKSPPPRIQEERPTQQPTPKPEQKPIQPVSKDKKGLDDIASMLLGK